MILAVLSVILSAAVVAERYATRQLQQWFGDLGMIRRPLGSFYIGAGVAMVVGGVGQGRVPAPV